MRDFLYSLMTDKKSGAQTAPIKFILYLVSLLYAFGIFCRRLLYKFGIFKSHKVPMKIISVGNLTLGGTGKTPSVIKIVEIFRDEIKKEPCVLIRGYGWDEQAMLKKKLPDTPIFVGEDRSRSARRAVRLYGSLAGILDDGFQHWELERDLDIVLVDSRNPFGNGKLFPRGILREPKDALKRADIVIFTKVNKALSDLKALEEEISRINSKISFLEAEHKPTKIYDSKDKKMRDPSYIGFKKVILVSSIGDSTYFEETVKGLKAKVVEHVAFGDHHNYKDKDIRRIIKLCDEKAFDFIVTTEKDAVKLGRMRLSFGKYPLMVLCIEMEIISGKEKLVDRLHSLYIS